MTTVDALWVLIQSQSKRVRNALVKRLLAEQNKSKSEDITKTAGYKEAMDDIKHGRVTEYASLKDFYKEMGLQNWHFCSFKQEPILTSLVGD